MKNSILRNLSAECPWRDTLLWFNETESTNNDAKRLAQKGASHGTVILAASQSAGRGRMGRSFLSPAGGIYMSVILRPAQKAADLLHLTCAVAVAACNAVESSCGFRPQVKWINDLVWQGKKLGGILTELSLNPDGSVNYAIVGIGINVTDYPASLSGMASCLSLASGKPVDQAQVTAALIHQLSIMDLSEKQQLMDQYRKDCLTLGQDVVVLRSEEKLYGKAISLADDGSLTVKLTDGSTVTVGSGEVSVRGMYGYV